jgi:hypothetical protein
MMTFCMCVCVRVCASIQRIQAVVTESSWLKSSAQTPLSKGDAASLTSFLTRSQHPPNSPPNWLHPETLGRGTSFDVEQVVARAEDVWAQGAYAKRYGKSVKDKM